METTRPKLVCHADFGPAISIQDQDERLLLYVWNQHAYSITNINDDLSVPVDATPNFTLYNGILHGSHQCGVCADLSKTITNVCEDDCDKVSSW